MTLQEAILSRKNEIRVREKDLQVPDYPGKDWAREEIELLNNEIRILEKAIAGEDNDLDNLARCLHSPELICLRAHKGFQTCWEKPPACDWSYNKIARVQQAKQEVLL